VKKTEPSVRTLLLVGHNPGLHDLARLLVGTATSRRASGSTRNCRPPAWR
jgi:phosphohistidine phosphatase SixA